MSVLQIRDFRSDATALKVDLETCLAAMESSIKEFVWQVAPVINARHDETLFDVTGDLELMFQVLLKSERRISTKELLGLSELTHQLIWAELRGFAHEQEPEPAIVIRAIDSTFFEIETERPEIIERVEKCFKDVVFQEHRWGTKGSGIPQSIG